jgi:hypothetical protein
MSKIQDAITGIKNCAEVIKPKDVHKILGVSLAWVYKDGNVPIEESCRASSGNMKKKYYVFRKQTLLKWLSEEDNQDALVKVWIRSEGMSGLRKRRDG